MASLAQNKRAALLPRCHGSLSIIHLPRALNHRIADL